MSAIFRMLTFYAGVCRDDNDVTALFLFHNVNVMFISRDEITKIDSLVVFGFFPLRDIRCINTKEMCIRDSSEIYHTLGKLLKEGGLATGVGDEGVFAPNLESDEEAIEWIIRAIETAGYSTQDVKIALDAASSEWYKDGMYVLPKRGTTLKSEDLVAYWKDLVSRYPIISIEDGLGEQDWEGWTVLTKELPIQDVYKRQG